MKHGNNKSKLSQHHPENEHAMGPFNEVMVVLPTTKKVGYFSTLEKFHICLETTKNNQINDKCMVRAHPLFDILIQNNYTVYW